MFKTIRPETLEAMFDAIDQEKYHIFAGGTDLMIRKRQWQGAERKFTQAVCYINHLDELRGIEETDDYYEVGTLTTQSEMADSFLPEYIKVPYSLMASPAIRNIATVGGNIVNAASVGDSIPVLLALDAKVELRSKYSTRILTISDFIIGKYKTAIKDNEILTKVLIPKKKYSAFRYEKLGQRKASILSKVSIFIVNNDLNELKIAIGAVNDTVIRSTDLEEAFIKDKDLSKLLLGYGELMEGKDDRRSTKLYREKVALNIIEDYLKEVIG